MAHLQEGFQEGFQPGVIRGFLCHVSENIPDITDDDLELLFVYMKSVGATSEEDFYKMNEEDLSNFIGSENAKLIMRYCKAKIHLKGGFQQDTIHVFLRHISENVPHITDRELELLFDYMKSVGATSEGDLGKMNERELGKLIGADKAKLIMRPGEAKETDTRKRSKGSTKATKEVDSESDESEEEYRGARASRSRVSRRNQRDGNSGELATVFERVLEMQAKEGEKNREMMAFMSESLATVTQEMRNTVLGMSTMMQEQLTLQKQVLETAAERENAMEKRYQENQAETRKWMTGVQDMNREYFGALTDQVNTAMRLSEERAKEQREESRRQESQAQTREWMRTMQDMNRQSFDVLTERIQAATRMSARTAEEQRRMKDASGPACVIQ